MLAITEQLPIEILSSTHEAVLEAPYIMANYPLAYTDNFAIAAAQRQNGVPVTGDPEFRSVKNLIRIEWIGKDLESGKTLLRFKPFDQ